MTKTRIITISILSVLLFASLTQVVLSTNTDEYWWPMFQHDIKNSGFSFSSGPESNEVAWSFKSEYNLNSPSVSDNRIYVGSNVVDASPSDDSYLYCLNLEGKIIWTVNTTGNLDSSPAIIDEWVYIGSDNGNVYCIDADNGELIWQKRLPAKVSSPVVNNSKLIIECLDGNVYCLDKNLGEILWKTQLSIDVLSTPIVVDNHIFVRNYCLDLFTGDIIWSSDVGIVLLSSPTFFEDKVYIGSRDEKMYCLNANTGEKLWRFYTGSMTYETAPSVAYGNVYVGNAFGFIYCVNATSGERVWSTKESARAVASPVICDEKLYIGSVDNHLYCLDAFSGEKIWEFSSDDDFFSSLAIAKNHLFGVSGKVLYCFGENINLKSDLVCSGKFSFSDVKPNEMVSSSFTVANMGEPCSKLGWKIESYPEWGEWSFSSSEGMNLSVSDNPIRVNVSVRVPNSKDQSFSGEIVVINKDDPSDVEIVEVVISTNKKMVRISPFVFMLERLMKLICFLS